MLELCNPRHLNAEDGTTLAATEAAVDLVLLDPEIEIGRFLTDVADFRHTPPLLGSVERVCPNGQTTAYAALLGFGLGLIAALALGMHEAHILSTGSHSFRSI